MKSHTHKCAAPNCERQIIDGLLMCPAHWARVPYALQRAVHRTWRSGGIKKYLATRQAAIASVTPPASCAKTL